MGGTRPWWEEDAALEGALFEAIPELERHRLDTFSPVPGPGAYLLFFCAPRLVNVLGAVIALGRLPCHIGKAKSLAERAGRYRKLGFIEPHELWMAALSTASVGAAAHCEALLQHRYRPVLTGSGFSSKMCGARRRPKPSLADSLLGPRSWASQPSRIEEVRARLRVLSYLARLDPAGERWPPLAAAGATEPEAADRPSPHRLRLVAGER